MKKEELGIQLADAGRLLVVGTSAYLWIRISGKGSVNYWRDHSGTRDSHFRRFAQAGRASFSLRPSVESRAVFCNLSNFKLHGLQFPKVPSQPA